MNIFFGKLSKTKYFQIMKSRLAKNYLLVVLEVLRNNKELQNKLEDDDYNQISLDLSISFTKFMNSMIFIMIKSQKSIVI